jgi:hypothetical protein
MKAIIEHLIVAVIAVAMAFFGYWLMGKCHGGSQKFIELNDVGWTIWSSAVSVVTWVYLYRMCRLLHWLVLPVMGLLSPIIGALLFVIPYMWAPFIVVWEYAPVIFPTGITCGFLVSLATLPFRPRQVLLGNA